MFQALLLSLAQLGDPAIRRVLAKSLGVTLAIFAVLGAAIWRGLDLALSGWRYHGALAGVAASALTLLALWLLFRAVAVLVVGLLADDVVAAVERRHYPAALASARAVPLHHSLRMGLGSAARFLIVNLAMTPVYIALLVTGVGTAAAFFVVNAWLLGRDLTDMVASRHLPAAAVRDWRKANAARAFLLGLAGTGLFVVPLVNLLAPVLGAAMATHLFHRTQP
ncbi:EI24 domain-containing protein [Sphingomonas sp.]|uniref:EI24 domain-containing protein n=1 Tax=Sphingomonas sp. TaxID=28214 RepID=UPI0035C7DB84